MNQITNINEQKIQTLEKEFLKLPQVECSLVHRFGPNIYIREVFIPAGTFSIGHYQNTTHVNVMLKGRVTMVNEDGSHTELIAPVTFISGPGRKIGYIHEDMVWQNIYSTNETDVEKIETMYLNKSMTWQEHQKNQNLLLSFDYSEDVADYYKALEDYGFDHETARKQAENTEDQIEMPFGSYKFMVSDSKIEGKGIFATGNFVDGEIVGQARIKGKRTPLGRYTNHSKTPNAIMALKENGDIDLVTKKSIEGCKGSNLGDEITIDYRQALRLSLQ